MDSSVIRSYLVRLGFLVDGQEKNKFDEALRIATSQITKFTEHMAKSFVEAGVVATTALTAIATGTAAMMFETAKADLGFALLARRMYMTKDAARSMQLALDALGVSAQDVIWGPP